ASSASARATYAASYAVSRPRSCQIRSSKWINGYRWIGNSARSRTAVSPRLAESSRALTSLRSAATTSRSSTCGAQMRRADAICAVAHEPRSPSSMRKSTSSDASETIIELAAPLLARFANELCRGNLRAHERPAPHALDHLLERGSACKLDDVAQEVFRERHGLTRRSPVERAV